MRSVHHYMSVVRTAEFHCAATRLWLELALDPTRRPPVPNTELRLLSTHACFGGVQSFHAHASSACAGEMRFSVYLPPQASRHPVPMLTYLAGLTCTEETFMTKAGAQQWAAEHGVMLVAPDTSPRNTGIPNETKDWDFGAGAGFYLDATQQPWAAHYRMFSYVTEELPALIAAHFPADLARAGIFEIGRASCRERVSSPV